MQMFYSLALGVIGGLLGIGLARVVRRVLRAAEKPAQLARSGASSDELMQQCGLEAEEAQLVLRLYGAERESR